MRQQPAPGSLIYYAYVFHSLREIKSLEPKLISMIQRVKGETGARVFAYRFEAKGKHILAIFAEGRVNSLIRMQVQAICVFGDQTVLDGDYETRFVGVRSEIDSVDLGGFLVEEKPVRIV